MTLKASPGASCSDATTAAAADAAPTANPLFGAGSSRPDTVGASGVAQAPPTPYSSRSPETPDGVLDRLARSSFRARFHLSAGDARYARSHGRAAIEEHAHRFIDERLAAANPENDGRQTPMRGHPVFRAQHATATCCRGCLAKHHGIVKHHPLTDDHLAHVVAVIMRWIERELTQTPPSPPPAPKRAAPSEPTLF